MKATRTISKESVSHHTSAIQRQTGIAARTIVDNRPQMAQQAHLRAAIQAKSAGSIQRKASFTQAMGQPTIQRVKHLHGTASIKQILESQCLIAGDAASKNMGAEAKKAAQFDQVKGAKTEAKRGMHVCLSLENDSTQALSRLGTYVSAKERDEKKLLSLGCIVLKDSVSTLSNYVPARVDVEDVDAWRETADPLVADKQIRDFPNLFPAEGSLLVPIAGHIDSIRLFSGDDLLDLMFHLLEKGIDISTILDKVGIVKVDGGITNTERFRTIEKEVITRCIGGGNNLISYSKAELQEIGNLYKPSKFGSRKSTRKANFMTAGLAKLHSLSKEEVPQENLEMNV